MVDEKNPLIRNYRLIFIALIVIVMISGCLGTTTDRESEMETQTVTPQPTESTATPEPTGWKAFEHNFTGTYTYEFKRGEEEGELRWDVIEVQADSVCYCLKYKINVSVQSNERTVNVTASGSRENVQQQLKSSPLGELLGDVVYLSSLNELSEEPLAVGDEWNESSNQGPMHINITGQSMIDSKPCYTAAITYGDTVEEICLSYKYGLPLHIETRTSDGEVLATMTLRDYSSG